MSLQDADALRASAAAADEELSQEPVGSAKKLCETRWLEVTVVTDRSTPYKQERVLLYVDGKESPPAKLTDDRGVARWDALPDGAQRFQVQLVDVLESWGPAARKPGRIPKPETFRREDFMVHDVEPCVLAEKQVVFVRDLTVPEKFDYFRQTYTDNKATYTSASPNEFGLGPPRWRWGQGAVCNEHINFFLAFWFNYNESFTAAGSTTCMGALPTFTSANQKIWYGTHRGYKEYLAPVTGGGTTYHHTGLDRDLEYHFVHAHFDEKDGSPTGDLYSKLGDISVYSISDEAQHIKAGKARRATGPLEVIRGWLKSSPGRVPPKRTIASLSEDELWNIAWSVQRSDADADALLKKLFFYAVFDHHAGILYKKADGQLYTFSADSGGEIHEKTFLSVLRRKKNLWMAFWNLEPLRPGGYAPASAEEDKSEISVDSPSRFIQWGGAGNTNAVKAAAGKKTGASKKTTSRKTAKR